MDPKALQDAMSLLADTGRTLDADWQSGKPAIAGHEGGIGSDVLAQAFHGIYDSSRTTVTAAADRLPRAILADADVGTQSAADYVAGDQRGAAGMPRPR